MVLPVDRRFRLLGISLSAAGFFLDDRVTCLARSLDEVFFLAMVFLMFLDGVPCAVGFLGRRRHMVKA